MNDELPTIGQASKRKDLPCLICNETGLVWMLQPKTLHEIPAFCICANAVYLRQRGGTAAESVETLKDKGYISRKKWRAMSGIKAKRKKPVRGNG